MAIETTWDFYFQFFYTLVMIVITDVENDKKYGTIMFFVHNCITYYNEEREHSIL